MMKKLLFFLFATTIAHAQQYVWTQKASLPGSSRHSSIGFSIGQYGYIGTGYSNGVCLNDLWRYDPVSNSWSQMATLPGVGRYGASSFVINNQGYVGVGQTTSIALTDFYKYDPVTNQWTSIANFIGLPIYTAVSFALNGLGYVATGYAPISNYVYQYNPGTNTWQQRANFSGIARQSAASFVVHDTAYVTTGYDGMSALNDFWRFNQLSDTWTQLQSIPGNPRYGAIGLTVNNNGIITNGGDVAGNYYTDCYQYMPAINQWLTIAQFPGVGRRHSASFNIGPDGYISCGVSAAGVLNDLWELSQVTSVSNPLPQLQITFQYFSASKTLLVKNQSATAAEVTLYSLSGIKVAAHSIAAGEEYFFQMNDMAKGIYLCRAAADNSQPFVTKFSVN